MIMTDDDCKVVETSIIKMFSLFGASVVLYFITILSGYRNRRHIDRYFCLHVDRILLTKILGPVLFREQLISENCRRITNYVLLLAEL